jgi:hypothetical protein
MTQHISIRVPFGDQSQVEKLGALETEVFISHLLREPFDYTEWRRDNLFAERDDWGKGNKE